MSTPLDLGTFRLSCPSTGLDLTLTSNASISTLAHSCFSDTPSLTDIESGLLWLAPATNLQLFLAITHPLSASHALRQRLLTALRHAEVSITFLCFASMKLTGLDVISDGNTFSYGAD